MDSRRKPMPPGLLQEEGASFYESLLDSLPLAVYRIDRQGRIVFANATLFGFLGIRGEGALGQVLYDFFPEETARRQREDDQRVFATGLSMDKVEDHLDLVSGRKRQLREIKLPVRSSTGEVAGIQGVFWDVTEQMQAQTELKESEERFNLFMDTLPAAVFIKNEDSTTLYCNRYMADIIGARSWLGKTVRELFPRQVAEKMIADDRRSLKAGYVVVEERVPNADGQVRLYQTHKFAIPRQGLPPLLGGVALDITERKQAELELETLNARLKILATTDQLTGLANRRHLTSILDREIGRMKRYDKVFSVILMDVDHFKSINDGYGHLAGDSALSQIAAILAGHVRAVDTPGRWGGEEFLIVCPETANEGALALAELLRQRIEQHDFGFSSHISASFGVATSAPGVTADALMKAVDDALYRAKGKNRNCVVSATI